MDFGSVIRQRLSELGLEQKELAAAAQVTESYISQLLTRKKAAPAPDRTDIYAKMERFLKLPAGRLANLVIHERKHQLKRSLDGTPVPLHEELRELLVRKCRPAKETQIRAIFEREPFGVLEHLVTRKLLDTVKNATRRELQRDGWLERVALRSGRSQKAMRVLVRGFLETDVFNVSAENCVSLIDPLVDSWDIDLATLGLEIVMNQRLAPAHSRGFEFLERDLDLPAEGEPGFMQFLSDPTLSGDASAQEIAFLKSLRFQGRRPTKIYYYRELQNLRDPLHFRTE